MQENNYRRLVRRYVEKKATAEELEVFRHLLEKGELDPFLDELMDEDFKQIRHFQTSSLPSRRAYQKRLAVAASIILFLISGLWFFINQRKIPVLAHVQKKEKIVPGRSEAVLTLSDGSKIILSKTNKGLVANQPGATITKLSGGEVVYNFHPVDGKASSTSYNTIETPIGGEYQVLLPDGTKVWLNAESSLRFPTSFSGHERKVQLTGEAYFEVKKNPDAPFRVLTQNQEVEVLGTHFNINSYADEPAIRTTLVEGRVKVLNTQNQSSLLLSPGEQAALAIHSLTKEKVNTDGVLAWKNGLFFFDKQDIKTIMATISRWYNVPVVYSADLPKERFIGTISRKENIKEVLGMLELTGQVHFKIDGRRVIVMR